MNRLLTLTAFIEATTGLALMVVPTVVVGLLLGGEVAGAAIAVGRVAGIALLALGLACWPDRAVASRAGPAFRGMLVYNLLATLYLAYLGVSGLSVGMLLWPAVTAHGILSFLLVRQWRLGNTGRQQIGLGSG